MVNTPLYGSILLFCLEIYYSFSNVDLGFFTSTNNIGCQNSDLGHQSFTLKAAQINRDTNNEMPNDVYQTGRSSDITKF